MKCFAPHGVPSGGTRIYASRAKHGKQVDSSGCRYVAVYAGGTSLPPSKRSDGVWLFSLDGAIESLLRECAEFGESLTSVNICQTVHH